MDSSFAQGLITGTTQRFPINSYYLTSGKDADCLALVVTAPTELRETLGGLGSGALARRCTTLRPGPLGDSIGAAKYACRSLGRRYRQLTAEIQDLEAQLDQFTRTVAPALIGTFGVGPDTAATLLVTAGSNPQRLDFGAGLGSLTII
jgi:transposase